MNINTFTFISDTHEEHGKLEIKPTYLLVHTGDATNKGNHRAITQFFNWFANQPACHKIFVPGNHDQHYFNTHRQIAYEECAMRGITLLLEDFLLLPPGIKIWGNACLSKTQSYSNIPSDIDILLTHEPPYKIRDKILHTSRSWEDQEGHLGVKELVEVNTKLHVFGHIHEQRGISRINNKIFINAANKDRVTGLLSHPPVVINTDSLTCINWNNLTIYD